LSKRPSTIGWQSFDGRVLEVFTPYREGSMRYHAALMVDCRIAGTTLTVDFQRPEVGPLAV